jgi:hypothetical protein
MKNAQKREIALRAARYAFIKRFGREPREGEPLLFDSDALGDTPVSMSDAKLDRLLIHAMIEAGTPDHLIYAYDKTGLILNEEGYSTASPQTRAEWDAVMEEFQGMTRQQRRTWKKDISKV